MEEFRSRKEKDESGRRRRRVEGRKKKKGQSKWTRLHKVNM